MKCDFGFYSKKFLQQETSCFLAAQRFLKYQIYQKYRSSRTQMFFKVGVLKDFATFTGKPFVGVSNTGVFL